MPGIVNQEWLNQNAGRAYPFSENMSLEAQTATGELLGVSLPNYVVVDMAVSIPAPASSQAGMLMYLSKFAHVGNLATFVITPMTGVGGSFTVAVDMSTHVANTAYEMRGTGDIFDARGWLVVGDLSRLKDDLPEGMYEFTPVTALFEPATVRMMLRGVRSISVLSGEVESAPIYGHVKLVAGANMRLRYDGETNSIVFDADPSSGYVEECECDDVKENVVKSINGVAVERVTLEAGDCISIDTSGNTIRISDTCSKPCCGCEELNYLLDSLKLVEHGLAQLETFAENLSERVNTFVANYLLSR